MQLIQMLATRPFGRRCEALGQFPQLAAGRHQAFSDKRPLWGEHPHKLIRWVIGTDPVQAFDRQLWRTPRIYHHGLLPGLIPNCR